MSAGRNLGLATIGIAAILVAPAARAQGVAAVVAAQQQRVESLDASVSGRLVLVVGSGKRVSYKCSIREHGFPDGVRFFEEVDAPQPVRVQVHLERDGRVTARLAHKGSTGKWLPGDYATANPSDALVGSGFSLEDLVDNQFFWKEQAIMGHQACGSRTCDVLQSTPASTDRSQYAKVVSSTDEKTKAVLHVIKTERGSGASKDMTYFDLHQSHGVYGATQIEVKVSGKAGSTLFIIDRGTAKAGLKRGDFDLASPTLEDPGQQNGDN